MRVKPVVFSLFAVLMLLAGGVRAQSGLTDDQLTLVRLLETAYRDLTANTYRATGEVLAVQNLDATAELDYFNDIVLELNWDFVVSPNRDALDDIRGTTQLYIELQDSNGEQIQDVVYESVLFAGTSYTNLISGVEGVRSSVWTQDPALPEESISRDLASTQPFSFYYLLSEQSVSDVVELDTSALDGEPVRNFEVRMSNSALQEAGVLSATDVGAGSNVSLTATLDALGGVRTSVAEYMLFVSIGADDGLPRSVRYTYVNDVEAVQGGSLFQQIEGEVRFSDYGAPVSIVNPLEDDPNAIDPALVERVQNAYAALRRANYRLSGTISGVQVVTADLDGGYRLETDIGVNYTSAVIPARPGGGLDRVESTFDVLLRNTENTAPPQVIDILYDYILDDEERTFTRLVDGEIEGALTDVWRGPTAAYSQPIPADRVNSEPFSLLYLVEPSLVDTITALGEITVEGIRTQAYELTLKVGVLQTIGVTSQTGIGENTDFNLVAFLGDANLIQSAVAEYEMVVYVGIESGLPHLVEFRYTNNVSSSFENAQAEQVIVGRIEFFDFGVGLSIEPPM